MQIPKLRDSKKRNTTNLYPLGSLPDDVLVGVSQHLVYLKAINKLDIGGDDWGDAFAYSINAKHLASPVGIADVIKGQHSWSTKTVKHSNPHLCKSIRVISGRNSPDYSYGIQNPHDDIQKTGTAVLGIWNERINIALDNYASLRSIILIRNFKSFEFCLFEDDTHRVPTNEYIWKVNKNGNLEGIGKTSGKHRFTWQPHGAQFTIKYEVPKSAIRFRLKIPEILSFEETVSQVGFTEDWIEILNG